ncbi:hypothetical protein PG985_006794 [Apiospora marii]|uniref:uncharacterized protein n=1 Tax=Apiospora marii TaxID=335849 RepID=UPI00312CE135
MAKIVPVSFGTNESSQQVLGPQSPALDFKKGVGMAHACNRRPTAPKRPAPGHDVMRFPFKM